MASEPPRAASPPMPPTQPEAAREPRPRGAPRARDAWSARATALRALERVDRDGAYAAAALESELARAPGPQGLAPADRALATALVYGVLRTRGALVARLEQVSARPLAKDPWMRLVLLVGAYQLLVLERVPAFAAVNEAVTLLREERGPRVAGFANAILRRLAAEGARLMPLEAALASAPEWLRARLEQELGGPAMRGLLAPEADAPEGTEVAVRLVAVRTAPEWLADAEPGRWTSAARRLRRKGDLRNLPGWSEGAFTVQEEGSQLVALALGARPGETALDVCAGRGQKTAILAERVGPTGKVVATDLYPRKLAELRRELGRLGFHAETLAVDWALPHAAEAEPRERAGSPRGAGASTDRPEPPATGGAPATLFNAFDRVLVDAPCTGSGTLRHRPELVQRLTPDSPARMATLQTALLRHAAQAARPGGRIVYAVCSAFREEGEGVVEALSDLLEPLPFDAPELEAPLAVSAPGTTASTLRLLPSTHGTDGYFIASLRRRSRASR